jgi:Alpha/beta hydrolase
VSAAGPAVLGQVAGWEEAQARGAVVALAGVADRLPSWRSRVDAVGRALGAPSGWSGPAAAVAAEAVALLSAVAVALGGGLRTALEQLQQAQVHAATAQPLARRALALAAGADVGLLPDGGLDRALPAPTPAMAADQAAAVRDRVQTASVAAALAEEALAEAALTRAAAAAAEADLPPAGSLHPVTGFDDLAGRLGLAGGVPAPVVPVGDEPAEVARWWSGSSLAAQLAAVDGSPELVGGLDGVPAWARDRANRELLRRALAAGPGPGGDDARAVAAALGTAQQQGRPVQLLEFDPRTGRAAVAVGDLDTATDVGILVPGMATTVPGDLADVVDKASRVRDAALAAAPAAAVATVAWLGYRSPQSLPEADNTVDARRGGALLDRTLTGLAATRDAAGRPRARTTVVAHSYGTLVAREAARRPGPLAADAVVLLGSPGMGVRGAAGLEAPEVYAAGSLGDPVSWLGRYGVEPTLPWYGATVLPTDPGETHGSYYDPRHPTLAALGRVVAGREPHR